MSRLSNTEEKITFRSYSFVRSKLLNREEIAFIDVREEAKHAEGHPLFAANIPFSRIELEAYTKLPRLTVPIVLIDNEEGITKITAIKLQKMGFVDVAIFSGGIKNWKANGGELFIDVNVPSKAFGELVEHKCHTPSLSAQEVQKIINSDKENVVILDVRRFDEYKTMSIPTAISVPGAELVLHISDIAPNPNTKIIINCAGRTRGLLGTQALINAGLPNDIAALRNGTIGWTLAEQVLDTGQSRSFPKISDTAAELAKNRTLQVANKAGVKRASINDVNDWRGQISRTTYFFDVRTQEEYKNGHLPGFFWIEGGQLIQETEMYVPVRGARIVLSDDDGARANMTASWLAQMAWDVYVLDNIAIDQFTETGLWNAKLPNFPDNQKIDIADIQQWKKDESSFVILDFSRYKNYIQVHIPGAYFVLRSQLKNALMNIPKADRYILTDEYGIIVEYIAPELKKIIKKEVYVLNGGNQNWKTHGLEIEIGESLLASPPIDRYKRPCEETAISASKMQAYLDWEFGLVAQLEKDGTHHFTPRNLNDFE